MVTSNLQGKFGTATQRLTIADHFFPIKPVHSFRQPICCDTTVSAVHPSVYPSPISNSAPIVCRRRCRAARPWSSIQASKQTTRAARSPPRRLPLQPPNKQSAPPALCRAARPCSPIEASQAEDPCSSNNVRKFYSFCLFVY